MSNTVNIDRVTKKSRRGDERVIEVWDAYAEGAIDLLDRQFPEDPLDLVRLVLAEGDGDVQDILASARQSKEFVSVNVDGSTIEWDRLEPLFAERA